MEEVLEWPSGVLEPSEIKTQFFFCKPHAFSSGVGRFIILYIKFSKWSEVCGKLKKPVVQMRSKEVVPFAQSPRSILSLSRLWSPEWLLTHTGFIDKKRVSTNISGRHCMSYWAGQQTALLH